MSCPKCKSAMVVLEYDHVEVDHCDKCGGVWLDASEIELLIPDLDVEGLLAKIACNDSHSETNRPCPDCNKPMIKAYADAEQRLLLDVCREDGIWFDEGELQTLLKTGAFSPCAKIFDFLESVFGETVSRFVDVSKGGQ